MGYYYSFHTFVNLWNNNNRSEPIKSSIGIYFFLLFFIACHSDIGNEDWIYVIEEAEANLGKRHEHGSVVYHNKMYLIGGRGLQAIDIVNLTDYSIKKGSPPPLEIHHFQPVVINNYIIVCGAFTGAYPQEKPISNMLVYDMNNDQWSIGDPIPESINRGSGGTVIIEDELYWIGGIKNGHIGGHIDRVDIFNLRDKTWTEGEKMLQPRDHFRAVAKDGKIYIAGGRRTKAPYGTFTATIKEVDVYDTETQSWSILTELPHPAGGTFTTLHGDRLIVGGGEHPLKKYALPQVSEYSLMDDTWTKLPELQSGRHGTDVVFYQGKLLIGGGSASKGDQVEKGDLMSYRYEHDLN